MPVTLQIDNVSAGPPYLGNVPQGFAVQGRASAGCTQVRVIVRPTPNGPALRDEVVPVVVPSGGTGDPIFTGVFSVQVPLPPILSFACGAPVWVHAVSVDDPSAFVSISRPIECKPAPDGNGGNGGAGPHHGPDDGQPTNGWPWPWPPFVFCPMLGRAFVVALLAALTALALGVATASPTTLGAAAAAFVLAATAYAIWMYWCLVNECVRLGAFCWVFKHAFIAAIPIAFGLQSAGAGLLWLLYGSAAGICVVRLRAIRCPVPSGGSSLGQLPF